MNDPLSQPIYGGNDYSKASTKKVTIGTMILAAVSEEEGTGDCHTTISGGGGGGSGGGVGGGGNYNGNRAGTYKSNNQTTMVVMRELRSGESKRPL
ncbi:MAG: hypothetical protein GY751_02815 [Bacteroidetes bacterium]|nr:hypothetical protein [Bacteroidota bacterium]